MINIKMKKWITLGIIGLFFALVFLIGFVNAQKLEIRAKQISPDGFNFTIILYDNENNKINGEIGYKIQDYYTDNVGEGNVNSGEEISFELPKNPAQGPWKISASYDGAEISELFNVGDVKRADIRLEGDNLIVENTGNVAYDKKILITIGNEDQTAQIYLDVRQTKKIRLTAPEGKYTIQVDDGSNKNLVFPDVSLTGNVVGLESASLGSFWVKYPLIVLFLGTLMLIIVIIVTLKIHERLINKKVDNKK